MNRIATLLQLSAVITLSVFVGALIFIEVAIVGFWQAIAPSLFLDWMSDNFWRFPMVMVPLNILALLLVLGSLIVIWKTYPDRRNLAIEILNGFYR